MNILKVIVYSVRHPQPNEAKRYDLDRVVQTKLPLRWLTARLSHNRANQSTLEATPLPLSSL